MALPTNQANQAEEIPLGQRLFDRPVLLLVFGHVLMFVFYTIWGLYEVLSPRIVRNLKRRNGRR